MVRTDNFSSRLLMDLRHLVVDITKLLLNRVNHNLKRIKMALRVRDANYDSIY